MDRACGGLEKEDSTYEVAITLCRGSLLFLMVSLSWEVGVFDEDALKQQLSFGGLGKKVINTGDWYVF